MHRFKLVMRVVVFLVAALAYGLSAVMPSGSRHRVLIRANHPATIEPPFKVEVLTEDGDRGLRIAPGAGRGWRDEAKGAATYHFYVPAEDSYTLWAYCLWGGACTNAVFAQVDGSERIILGNDPVYQLWHWVRSVEWKLARGTHKLTLSNHSDGIAIQRLMLLGDPLARPDGGEAVAYCDLFYDGFDGCDGGNIAAWQLTEKHWRLYEPLGKERYERRVLVGKAGALTSPGDLATAVVGEHTWRDYAVNVSIRALQEGLVAICFDWQGPDHYFAVQWRPPATGASPHTPVELVQVSGGRRALRGSLAAPLVLGGWVDVGISVPEGQLAFSVDGVEAGRIEFEGVLKGKVALMLADGGQAWFDDLHIRYPDSSAIQGGRTKRFLEGRGYEVRAP